MPPAGFHARRSHDHVVLVVDKVPMYAIAPVFDTLRRFTQVKQDVMLSESLRRHGRRVSFEVLQIQQLRGGGARERLTIDDRFRRIDVLVSRRHYVVCLIWELSEVKQSG